MAKNINNMITLSMSVRKLAAMSNNVAKPVRLLHTSFYCKCTREKENNRRYPLLEDKKISLNKYSSMVNKLHDCSTPSHVFQLINENAKKMDGREAVEALTILFSLDKSKSVNHDSIPRSNEFSILCDILKSNIRQLSSGDAIQSLKVLNHFQIPTSTVIIQMLLQIIRNSVNNLSLSQVLFSNFLISKCQKTPLVEALSIALPIILESRIKLELDTENIDMLVNLLRYFAQLSPGHESISAILKALNNFDVSLMTSNHALTVLTEIINFDANDTIVELLKKCQQVLINSMDDLDRNHLKIIFTIMGTKHNISYNILYNESLLDACAMRVVSKDMGLTVGVHQALINFNRIGYTNISLLDYLAAKSFENKEQIKKFDNLTGQILIYGMSIADYKPVFWETLKNLLLNENLLENSMKKLIRISINLATLDCYWSPLLAKIFASDYKSLDFFPQTKKMLILLNSLVKINYTKYDGPLPSEKLIEMCMSLPPLKQTKFPLKSALEDALGGPQYILTNIKSKFGYYIDNVIIMRKGGFPIAINNSDEFISSKIEDLKPPQDSQVILFLHIPRKGVIRNTQRLNGFWSLLIRTLKSEENYTVIPVHGDMWQELTESEQSRYIAQAIRLKCDELSAVVNS